MYPDFSAKNRLELFARDKAEDWTSYGFEAPGTDEAVANPMNEAPDDLSIPACLQRSAP